MEMKIIWLMGVFLILICLALAIEQTTFSDGTSAKNLTFTTGGSKYINISLPNNANVTNASLFLEGLLIRNGVYDNFDDNDIDQLLWNNKTVLQDAVGHATVWENGGKIEVSSSHNRGSLTLHNKAYLRTNLTMYSIIEINFSHSYSCNSAGGTTTCKTKFDLYNTSTINTGNSVNVFTLGTNTNNGDDEIGTTSGTLKLEFFNDSNNVKVYFNNTLNGTYSLSSLNNKYLEFFSDSNDDNPTGGGSNTYLYLYDITYIDYPTNITIKTDNVQVYQNLSEFNGTSTIDLNTTVLQNCINNCSNPSGGNCLCELNFTSATAGILQLSNLNITYSMPPNSTSFTNTTDWTGNYYTTDTPSRAVTINSTFGINVTNCNLNVSASSLRSILTQNETNFTIENNSLKTVLVSFPTPSALDYSGHYLWAECDGNNKTGNINIEFSVANVPAPSTGGGGGGEVILITPNATRPMLFFGLTVVDFTILRTPSQGVKEIPIRNIGNETFKGSITVEGNVKDYFTVELCNIDGEKCSFKDVEISYGETKLLVIKGIFDESIGEGKEGIIKFRSGEPERTLAYYQRTLGIADGNVQTFELGLTISRYPLYRVVNYLSGQLGVPEMAIAIGLIVIIGVIVGVIVVMNL